MIQNHSIRRVIDSVVRVGSWSLRTLSITPERRPRSWRYSSDLGAESSSDLEVRLAFYVHNSSTDCRFRLASSSSAFARDGLSWTGSFGSSKLDSDCRHEHGFFGRFAFPCPERGFDWKGRSTCNRVVGRKVEKNISNVLDRDSICFSSDGGIGLQIGHDSPISFADERDWILFLRGLDQCRDLVYWFVADVVLQRVFGAIDTIFRLDFARFCDRLGGFGFAP